MNGIFRASTPVAPKRVVHLDLKGVPPTAKRLVELLDVVAAASYNAVLVEWEDQFPWRVDERFRSPTAYTPAQVRAFAGRAAGLGIEIIPLVQCLGHMETPLRTPGYERLRETPDSSAVLNPLAPGAQELVAGMVRDVLELLPETRRFHLGGDEAWTMGSHPDTRRFIEEHGKGALYMRHVGPLLDLLNGRGARPMLWHDMMVAWEDEPLRELAAKCNLVAWGYNEHPDETRHHFRTPNIRRFRELGFTLWGGTAYKGADGQSADLPDPMRRQENALAWVDIAKRFGFEGLIATAWSRYSSDRPQCEPIDAALDSLFNIGVILHDGCPPEGGLDACAKALEAVGEGARWAACKAAMSRLSAARDGAWQVVRIAREQSALGRLDPARRSSGLEACNEARLRRMVDGFAEIESAVRTAFDGLIEPVWIDEYLATRLDPLRDLCPAAAAPGALSSGA